MAEHKHATEVAIASTTDQSEFPSWVFRWWKAGALVLFVGAATLVVAQYQDDAAAADALLKVGAKPADGKLNKAELAAWTSIARVVLNLHETITRN